VEEGDGDVIWTERFTGSSQELQLRGYRQVENWSDAGELQVLRKSRFQRLVEYWVVHDMGWSVRYQR